MQAAFLKLIEQKPLDEISIKEITETAGLSYPTFFRRYATKSELVEEIATSEVRSLLAVDATKTSVPSADALCRYVDEHRVLWTVLLNGGAAHVMREEFKRLSEEESRTRPRANPWLPVDLAVPFVTSGIFEILAWWLRQPADYPLEDVVTIFNALIVDVAARPRNVRPLIGAR